MAAAAGRSKAALLDETKLKRFSFCVVGNISDGYLFRVFLCFSELYLFSAAEPATQPASDLQHDTRT